MVTRARRSVVDVLRLVVVCLVLVIVVQLLSGFSGWKVSLNPFHRHTVDRTGPSVLKSLTNISEFHPLSAHFETVVDLEDDTQHLPSWISGERVIYVGKGDVDSIVDFSDLDEQAVTVTADTATVHVRLPEPTIGTPVLDLKQSYVANHDEGLLTRFSGSDLEQQTQQEAVTQMASAAKAEPDLIPRSEDNTTAMLRGLLSSLGFTHVTITYGDTS